MPRRATSRSKAEDISKPRARGGNTWAVGAYLKKLRGEVSQEQLIRQILTAKNGKIIMSLSTLVQIENGNTKGSTASTIAAIRQAVGGDPYDIEDLYDLPVPEDDDSAGIEASRLEGESRAIARRQQRHSSGGVQIDVRGNDDPKLRAMLVKVANDERLQSVVKQLADDPTALKYVVAMLKG